MNTRPVLCCRSSLREIEHQLGNALCGMADDLRRVGRNAELTDPERGALMRLELRSSRLVDLQRALSPCPRRCAYLRKQSPGLLARLWSWFLTPLKGAAT